MEFCNTLLLELVNLLVLYQGLHGFKTAFHLKKSQKGYIATTLKLELLTSTVLLTKICLYVAPLFLYIEIFLQFLTLKLL